MNSMEGGGLERVHLHIECSPWWWGGGPVASRWFPQSKVHEATRSVAAFNQFIQWPFELVDDLLTMCWVVPLTTLSKLVGFHQIWSFFWTTFFFWPLSGRVIGLSILATCTNFLGFFSNLNWEVCQFSRHKFGWFWPKLVFFFGRVINSRFWNFRLIFKNPIFWLFYFPNAQFMGEICQFSSHSFGWFWPKLVDFGQVTGFRFWHFRPIFDHFWMTLNEIGRFQLIFLHFYQLFSKICRYWSILANFNVRIFKKINQFRSISQTNYQKNGQFCLETRPHL